MTPEVRDLYAAGAFGLLLASRWLRERARWPALAGVAERAALAALARLGAEALAAIRRDGARYATSLRNARRDASPLN